MTSDRILLDESIRYLRKVFSAYRFAALKPTEPACDADQAKLDAVRQKLLAVSFDGLTARDLLDYYYLAVEHIGDADDLRHFLPKLLEMMAKGDGSLLTPAHLPALFRNAGVSEWPAEQRRAIESFAAAAAGMGIISVTIASQISKITSPATSE